MLSVSSGLHYIWTQSKRRRHLLLSQAFRRPCFKRGIFVVTLVESKGKLSNVTRHAAWSLASMQWCSESRSTHRPEIMASLYLQQYTESFFVNSSPRQSITLVRDKPSCEHVLQRKATQQLLSVQISTTSGLVRYPTLHVGWHYALSSEANESEFTMHSRA